MKDWLTSVLVPLITAVVASGLIVSILRIRPERRQINAGAGKDEATTADILTGTALKMVVHAQQEAERAQAEVIALRTELTAQRILVESARHDADSAMKTSITCAAEVMRQAEMIQAYTIALIQNGIAIPQV